MGLPCLLLPGFLLLALMPYYYISKRAKFTGGNLAGACGLAALFDIHIFTKPLNYIILAMYGDLIEGNIQWTKLLIPFTLGK